MVPLTKQQQLGRKSGGIVMMIRRSGSGNQALVTCWPMVMNIGSREEVTRGLMIIGQAIEQ
jgi:hypothetical protein